MKKIALILWFINVTATISNAQNPAVMSKLSFENRSDRIEVVRGTPVILYYRIISLLQTDREEVLASIPDSLHSDPEILKRLDSVFKPLALAPEGSSWLSGIVIRYDAPGMKRFNPPALNIITPVSEDVSSFDHGNPIFVYYGIDPEVTRTMQPGKVNLKIGSVINNGSDTLWSKPVELIFLKSIVKNDKVMNPEQKMATAKYRLRRGQCREAESLARYFFNSDTTSVANILLLADAHECAGRNGAALELLLKALMKLMEDPISEVQPPDVLMLRIMMLQEKVMKFEPVE